MIDDAYRTGKAELDDLLEDVVASGRGEFLGIIEADDFDVARENYRCGNDRSGERATPGLVHPADAREAALEEHRFEILEKSLEFQRVHGGF